MATMWRRTMLYLGLGPDDEYEDDLTLDGRPAPEPVAARPQPAPRPQPAARPPQGARPAGAPATRPAPRPASAAGRPPGRPRPTPVPVADSPEPSGAAVRQLPSGGEQVAPKPKPVVRQVPAAAKPYVVSPTHFNHAQEVADRFKGNQPVILNLQGVDKELARRLIDFCSGLCYGLTGHMEKVAQQVYLLTPTNVEVSAEERRRLHERGLHDG